MNNFRGKELEQVVSHNEKYDTVRYVIWPQLRNTKPAMRLGDCFNSSKSKQRMFLFTEINF